MVNGFELVKPGEERWDSARAAWNLAIDQRPGDGGAAWRRRRGRSGRELRSRERLARGCAGRGPQRGCSGWGRRGHAAAQDGAHDGGRDRR